ncbi:hypothetical protein C8R31_10316 [Nitrosospira sp. Nsp2]|uniref:hypothetical protein n=1 Tax=Nitrosospira sp. Nsp2 TaxID=136548 RepID=UPI000D30DFC5|nr:hypothetical protein [Nitrosospira sp. Nsp2]PTR15433.1 hypothetical protein C8R31_10316 [Nitrosospira sp. Nsp2]
MLCVAWDYAAIILTFSAVETTAERAMSNGFIPVKCSRTGVGWPIDPRNQYYRERAVKRNGLSVRLD